jgi:hypothetical protein
MIPEWLFGDPVNADLETQLQQLPQMSRAALCNLWLQLFGQAPSSLLRREVLLPILAYRLQERARGGLKPSVAKRLCAIAKEVSASKRPSPEPAVEHLKPGSSIVREWQGKMHVVTASVCGFEYNGSRFNSLSQIAREITGTRWSGPAFFGLQKRRTRRAG